jgi:hypothetical protein
LKRVPESESRKDFALLMREFIAFLYNGHSQYSDSQAFGSVPTMGFNWRYIDGRWTVTRSLVDGLAPGDLVLKINGKDVEEHFRETVKYLTGSDDRARRGQFLSILSVLLPNACSLDVQARTGIELNGYFRNAQLTWQGGARESPTSGPSPAQREDLYAGKDRALELAIEEAKKKT